MKLRRSLSLVVLAAFVFLSLLASHAAYRFADSRERASIAARIEGIAGKVPQDELGHLAGDRSDIENPSYVAIKAFLEKKRQDQGDVRFLYLIGMDGDGALFFHADSEPSGSGDYSPPGQRYSEATPAMYRVFTERKGFVEGPNRDRWGIWMSAYVPVSDTRGNTALLGMDISAARYFMKVIVLPLAPFSLAVLCAALFAERRKKPSIS